MTMHCLTVHTDIFLHGRIVSVAGSSFSAPVVSEVRFGRPVVLRVVAALPKVRENG